MFKFDLLPNERVLNIYRQSESVLFKSAIIVLVLIYLPWYFLLKYDLAATYPRLLIFWTILVLIYALKKYLVWLLNVYLVTDKRLIIINYESLFHKRVLETTMEKILNVGFTVKGFWKVLFKLGTVEVQAIGLSEPLMLKNISEPSKVKDFLWSLHQSQKKTNVYQTSTII